MLADGVHTTRQVHVVLARAQELDGGYAKTPTHCKNIPPIFPLTCDNERKI